MIGVSWVGIVADAINGVPVAALDALCDLDDDVRSCRVGCVDFLVVWDLTEVAWEGRVQLAGVHLYN